MRKPDEMLQEIFDWKRKIMSLTVECRGSYNEHLQAASKPLELAFNDLQAAQTIIQDRVTK